MGSFQQALGGDTGENPAELGDFWDVRLAEKGVLVEVHAQGSEHRHQVIGMFLQLGGFPNCGQSMVISNEVEGVVRLLQLQRGSQGTKIVAQMGSARRLDACQGTQTAHASGAATETSAAAGRTLMKQRSLRLRVKLTTPSLRAKSV